MCNCGRAIECPYADAELAALREGLANLGLTHDELTVCAARPHFNSRRRPHVSHAEGRVMPSSRRETA